MPSSKPSGWPPRSGGAKARCEYHVPCGKMQRAPVEEVRVGVGERQGRDGFRQRPDVDDLPGEVQDLDHARVRVGELALEQLPVVVGAELAQHRLERQIGAGERPVAGAERDRLHAGGLRLLQDVEELRLTHAPVFRDRDAELLHQLLVVVDLVGVARIRNAPGMPVAAPCAARPRLDLRPVDQVLQRLEVAVVGKLDLVRLGVDHVRPLPGAQRGAQRGEQRVLVVVGDLDALARVVLLVVRLDRVEPFLPAGLVAAHRPDRKLLRLSVCARCPCNGEPAQDDCAQPQDSDRHDTLPHETRSAIIALILSHLPASAEVL